MNAKKKIKSPIKLFVRRNQLWRSNWLQTQGLWTTNMPFVLARLAIMAMSMLVRVLLGLLG